MKTQQQIERALQLATPEQLARALAQKRALKCECGQCATCKQRAYRRDRRKAGHAN
jgi:hypothetical protein